MKPETLAIHGGEHESHPLNSITAPVFQTSIHSMDRFDDLRRFSRGESPGLFLYARGSNPTVKVAEQKIAELEGAEAAVATSSGMAAAFLIATSLLESGDEVIAIESVYAGVFRMLKDTLPRFGIQTHFLPGDDLRRLPEFVNAKTRMLWIESPSNPFNRVVDLGLTARLAREYNLLSVIDGTLGSPVNQRPLSHGLDLVFHSATKYLSGHSDMLAGVVVGAREMIERLRRGRESTGAVLAPALASLLIRGIKTLDLRVRRVNDNSLKLALLLESHTKVERVHYAGLPSSPYHEIARRQMDGFGGVVSMELADEAAVERFCDALRLIKISTSLGGVETVVTYPIYSSHAGFSEDELQRLGVTRGTTRFSVGVEAFEDLADDVSHALESV